MHCPTYQAEIYKYINIYILQNYYHLLKQMLYGLQLLNLLTNCLYTFRMMVPQLLIFEKKNI